MTFKPGDRVIVTIDGHDSEWTVRAAYPSWLHAVRPAAAEGPGGLIIINVPKSLVRPVPMEEPTEWGAKVTDGNGDHWLFAYSLDPKREMPRVWVCIDGTLRFWDEIKNPRPYTGGDDD